MKKVFFVFTLLFLHFICKHADGEAQGQKQGQLKIDSLLSLLSKVKEDTSKVNLLVDISQTYNTINPDEGIKIGLSALQLAEKIHWKKGIASASSSLGLNYSSGKSDASIGLKYFTNALAIYMELNDSMGISGMLNSIGTIHLQRSDYPNALEYLSKALKINEESDNKRGIAINNGNIGIVYSMQSDYPRALEYDLKALKMSEEMGDKSLIATNLSKIGNIYRILLSFSQALEYFNKSLKLYETIGDKIGVAENISKIGSVYDNQGKNDLAIDCFIRGLKIYQDLGNKKGIATCIGNIGNSYANLKDFAKANEHFFNALQLYKELGDKKSIAKFYGNIGSVYLEIVKSDKIISSCNSIPKNKSGALKLAKIYLDSALSIQQNVGNLKGLFVSYKQMSEVLELLGENKEAFESYKKYTLIKDSVFNMEKEKKFTQAAMQYEFEKKEAVEKVLQEKKDVFNTKELQREKFIRNSFIGSFFFVLILAGVLLSSYRNKKKTIQLLEEKNLIIIKQKEEVIQNNNEIKMSIQYALRIQNAILPPARLVRQYLENSFIVYKPKDIVAGDFYWMETVEIHSSPGQSETLKSLKGANLAREDGSTSNQQHGLTDMANEIILFAACDCTGHGVPGAMVSVVCHNALNRAVREFGLTKPSEILDRTNEIVKENFSKSEDDIKDGMDISLCAFHPKTSTLQWAGANNPLWLIRNGELMETKADKQPIGKNEDNKPFTNYEFQLNSNDSIYVFTDGFADQFGGESGKKLTKKRFRELLLSNQSVSMPEQGAALDTFITGYRNEIDQTDDILIMGVRI